MKNKEKDKEFYDLLMYIALCGRYDSHVLIAAERAAEEDYVLFEELVRKWEKSA